MSANRPVSIIASDCTPMLTKPCPIYYNIYLLVPNQFDIARNEVIYNYMTTIL